MKKPKAILFDLCDTLFLFDESRFPRIRVDGREVRSTLGLVHRVLSRASPLSFESFYGIFIQTGREIARVREEELREVTLEEKFGLVLERLGLGDDQLPQPLRQEAMLAHMQALSSALVFPPSHRALIGDLKGKYPIGIVSNFDHSPTVHQMLRREDIQESFDPVVISADVGWRKPRPEIFQKALDGLGLAPEEVLFIGDQPVMDVEGADAMGMPALWFNRHGEDPAGKAAKSQGILNALSDLPRFLQR